MYRRCPDCGAYLDPCEPCDCQDPEADINKKAAMPASTAAPPDKGALKMTHKLYHKPPYLSIQGGEIYG